MRKGSEDIRGIVFYDLDGTLLDNDKNAIPDSTKRALELLRRHYKVVLSTGRDMDSHYSVRWKAEVAPDAIIHMNGTKITVGDEPIFEHYMDPELLSRIYDFSMKTGICFGTTIGDRDYYTNPEKKDRADLAFTRAIRRNYCPFSELIEGKVRIHALSYAGDLDRERPMVESAFPQLELFGFDSGVGADVVEKGFSKADGMRRVCAYYEVDEDRTYAFGDSENDIMIIREAGTGVAMGNAVEHLKALADHVTAPIWDDGIYKACVQLGLIGEEDEKRA